MTQDARAAEINPYAPPAAIGGPQSPGVGVWREGPLLVMHKDAELPRLCIYTGHPAAGMRAFRAIWKSAGDILSREKTIQLPLRQDHLRAYARARFQSRLGLALGGMALVTMFSLPALIPPDDWMVAGTFLFSLLTLKGVILWWINYRLLSEPIKSVSASGDYLWFAGVHPAFLDHLPPWQPQ